MEQLTAVPVYENVKKNYLLFEYLFQPLNLAGRKTGPEYSALIFAQLFVGFQLRADFSSVKSARRADE